MVARNPKRIRCGERCLVDIVPVSLKIVWTGETRTQQTFIPDALDAAMFGQLRLMYRQYDAVGDPNPGHGYFARARRTLRRFFMMRSAAFICCSKAGS
jgi:hypothetical protein